jgi:hypothetical protein
MFLKKSHAGYLAVVNSRSLGRLLFGQTGLSFTFTRVWRATHLALLLLPAFSVYSVLPTAVQVNQEMVKLDQEFSHRYVRRSFDHMDEGRQWGEFNMTYAPWATFTSEAGLYFPRGNWGGFLGLQVYHFEVKNISEQQDPLVYVPGQVYLKNPFGANLITGAHYQFFPGARLLGGLMLSAARASRLSDDEALRSTSASATTSTLSRGLIPYAEYEHPWAKSFKTKADIAVNPSDLSSIAQWGLRMILELSGFEVQGEIDDVKTLGGRQIMAGFRGTLLYGAPPAGNERDHIVVRAGRISRTNDSALTLPEVQSLKTGNYVTGEVWHGWFIGGISFVENVGPGVRAGFGASFDKFKGAITAQYKYLMSDIYGARVDDFSFYVSILAKDII